NLENRKKINLSIKILKENKEFVEISFIEKKKNIKIKYYFNFYYKNENVINISLFWEIEQNEITILSKNELINSSEPFKIFISFKLKNFSLIEQKNFIKNIEIFLIKFELNFFVSNDIISIIIFAKNENDFFKLKEKIKKSLENPETKSLINRYSLACSIVEGKNIDSDEKLYKELRRIHFSLIKSEELGLIFEFNIKNIYFNEFEEYKQSFNYVYNEIEEISDVKIIDIFNEKKEIKYKLIEPKLILESNEVIKKIANENNVKNTIIDRFFDLAINKKDFNYIIEINDYLIPGKFDKLIKNNNNLFLINFIKNKTNQEIINILNFLSNKNIKHGIKTLNFSNIYSLVTIIENTKPFFVIIDGKNSLFIKKQNLKMVINLSIKNNFEIIYENYQNINKNLEKQKFCSFNR
ncbi:MAG: hypothetical protein ACRCRZ_02440, partial [Metamycoplasmataceae bacterium]